jgi:hypothetical protein
MEPFITRPLHLVRFSTCHGHSAVVEAVGDVGGAGHGVAASGGIGAVVAL